MWMNFPGRAAPIKEGTVLEFILEAGREGYEISWSRFCREIELTNDIYCQIEAAVAKVGTTDKLKPIKDELPEHVTYLHIKAYLIMQEKGVSAEEIERPSESNKPGGDPNLSFKQTRSSEFHGDDLPVAKCGKIETEDSSHMEATVTSTWEWIRGRDEASFSDIVEHFNGSERISA